MVPPPGVAGYPPPAAAPLPGGPIPPPLHWGVLLILTWFTGGLAGLVWSFKQAFFVKRLDPSSKAVMLLAVTLLGMLAQVAVAILGIGARSMADTAALVGIVMLLNLVIVVVALMAIFGMRKSIVQYYNTREPIGLKLSGVMTFFFSILYFQYHFSRIAEWKKTGRLN